MEVRRTLLESFYLGAPEPAWLARTTMPLFLSYHRLKRYRAVPRSKWRGAWALDSGGYNHLRENGTWTVSAAVYVADVIRWLDEVGNLEWAAPQDWMCEPDVLAVTGLTVEEHQRRTVANYVECARIWADSSDDECFVMPVLQGDPHAAPDELVASYQRCWDMYEDAGVDLDAVPLVGLGSVCRQQATDKIVTLAEALQDRSTNAEGMPLHGFGCKTLGLRQASHLLISADSMAWSTHARRNRLKWSDCPVRHGRDGDGDCRNCPYYAQAWRRNLLGGMGIRESRPIGYALDPAS